MANILRSNRNVIRAIDGALEKTWDQCQEAAREKLERDHREREHTSLIDRALSRMKSGPRERYVNTLKENPDALKPRFLTSDEVKKMKVTDAGSSEFKSAIQEPVAVRRHIPQGASGQGENMINHINKLNAERK
jgi:hypothetical protein